MKEELLFRVQNSDFDTVSNILEQSDNDDVILLLLEYVNEDQWTLLDIASYKGHLKIVELILQKKESSSGIVTDLTFSLALALGKKHYDIFHLLLGYKDPSLAAFVTSSEDPVFAALTTGNRALFQILQEILQPYDLHFHITHAVEMMSPQQMQRCFLWTMEQQGLDVLRDVLLDIDGETIAVASCLLPMPCQHHIFCTILKQYIAREKKKSLTRRVESTERLRESSLWDQPSQVISSEVAQDILSQPDNAFINMIKAWNQTKRTVTACQSEVVQDIISQDLLSKDVINMIKALGSDVFQPSDEEGGNSLLHLAMRFGRRDVLSALLDLEIDFPTMFRRRDAVSALLDNEIDFPIMASNKAGLIPIEVTDDDDLIGLIIRDKRSLFHHVRSKLGKTILRHMCSMDKNDETYYNKIDSFFDNNFIVFKGYVEAVMSADENKHDYILWSLLIYGPFYAVEKLSRFFEALLAGHEHDARLKDNKESFLHLFARHGFSRGIDYATKNFDSKNLLHQKICSDMSDLYLQEDIYKQVPCMVAADSNNHNALILLLQPLLTLSLAEGDKSRRMLDRFLHHEDSAGHTLLYKVSLHKDNLRLPHLIIVGLEHICHDDDMIAIQKCLKDHNIGNKKALNPVAVESPGPCKRWINFIVRGILALISLGFFLLDIATDALLVRDYHLEMENETILQQQKEAFRNCQYNVTLDCFTTVPTADTKFAISLSIMILPFLFYIVEIIRYFRQLYSSFRRRLCYTSRLERFQLLCSRAHVIEMSTESSIQPLLQLYLFLPALIALLQNAERLPDLRLTDLTNTKAMQLYSVIVSVLSMTYPFAAQYRRKKAKEINTIGIVMYFTFTLCFILSRLLAFLTFAYYFGPANFVVPAISLICHIIIMVVLDDMFKLYKELYIDKIIKLPSFDGTWIIYNCIMNGFANIFVLNGIDIFYGRSVVAEFRDSTVACKDWTWKFCNPCLNLWKRKAKLRQFIIFDVIISVENIIMVSFGFAAEVYQNDPSYKKALDIGVFIILGLFICGVILKICYYSFCHVWSDLICQCGEADNESDEMMEMRVKYGSSAQIESQNNHVESARVPLMEPPNENQIEVYEDKDNNA